MKRYHTLAQPRDKQNKSAADGYATLRTRWQEGLRSPLARRLVALTILCSTALAIVMTLIQLSMDYLSDRSELESGIRKIEQSILPGLAESLWVLDIPVMQSQLDGITRIDGVVAAALMFEETSTLQAGDPGIASSRVYKFPILRHSAENSRELGLLTVSASFTDIMNRTLRRGGLILGTNFIKSIVVAGVVLLIYQYLIGQHLTSLARFADNYRPEDGASLVHLDRGPSRPGELDELDALTRSMEAQSQIIARYVKQLQDANREQQEFTYAVSHDLKSPTNTLHMLLQELELTAGEDLNSEGREVIDEMKHTTRRMGQLVDDVLLYARTIGEGMSISEIDLAREVRAILGDLNGEITTSEAEVTYTDLPTVLGNGVQLRLLMQNLISNAIKFRDPARRPRIGVSSVNSRDGNWIQITVTDNGIGIDKEHKSSIFGLFKRLHSHGAYPGSGIGLTLCHRIVSNHGGRIEVQSQRGMGSSFTVFLPRERALALRGE